MMTEKSLQALQNDYIHTGYDKSKIYLAILAEHKLRYMTFRYRITGYFSGNLILALLAVVLVTLKIINANKTVKISMN
jgi:hypothetical protein